MRRILFEKLLFTFRKTRIRKVKSEKYFSENRNPKSEKSHFSLFTFRISLFSKSTFHFSLFEFRVFRKYFSLFTFRILPPRAAPKSQKTPPRGTTGKQGGKQGGKPGGKQGGKQGGEARRGDATNRSCEQSWKMGKGLDDRRCPWSICCAR